LNDIEQLEAAQNIHEPMQSLDAIEFNRSTGYGKLLRLAPALGLPHVNLRVFWFKT
jgi:hypothetical protein